MLLIKLLVLLSVISLPQIHAEEPNEMFKSMTNDFPSLGSTHEAFLGDKLLTQVKGEYRDCIVPSMDHTKSKFGGTLYTIKANVPICKTEPGEKHYKPDYINYSYPQMNSYSMLPVVYSVKKGKGRLCIQSLGWKGTCAENLDENDVKIGPHFVVSPNSTQKSIEYISKSNKLLTFSYNEYTDNWSNALSNREFDVDLDSTNIIGYKGSKIKVLETNDGKIRYVVLTNFSQESATVIDTPKKSVESDDGLENELEKIESLFKKGLIDAQERSELRRKTLKLD
ncbi:MAG: hypothetical protein ACJ0RL_05570 [Porticoccaceae bacterium]